MSDTLALMAKKQQGDNPPADKTGTESVRVEKDLARKLTMIAIKQGVSVSEILSPRIRDWVDKLYRDMVRKMNAELDEGS